MRSPPPANAAGRDDERTARAHRCGRVAIIGRPSVGKSTLLNRLVGAKLSITSRKPQTTRHRINGILTEPGRQFVFVDTPGFQTRHRSRLNERLNRAVRDSLADVDVVVWVVDAAKLVAADREVVALVPEAIADRRRGQQDRRDRRQVGIAASARGDRVAAVVRGDRADLRGERARSSTRSRTRSRNCCRKATPLYADDELTDRDERFLAAEFVREKIFRLVGEEIPYSTTVTIDRFEQEGQAAPDLRERARRPARASARSCSARTASG